MEQDLFVLEPELKNRRYGQEVIHHNGDLSHVAEAMTFLKKNNYNLSKKNISEGIYSYAPAPTSELSSYVILRTHMQDAVVVYTSKEGREQSKDIVSRLRKILEEEN